MFFKIVFILLLSFLVVDSGKKSGVAGEGKWTEPWVQESFPPRERAQAAEKADSLSQKVGGGLIKFFQTYISPVDGDRCPSYPTCSQYAMEAIRKHGAIPGMIMGFGRLIHEFDEIHLAPTIKVYDSYRSYDPVENNDFWWAPKTKNR